jgi:hypothetical protein
MASHLRYKRTVVSEERQTQYFHEAAEIARRLGARDIPVTPQQVTEYLQDMRPRLRCDERTREVANVLLTTRLPGRLTQPAGQLMMRAGIDLLPPWAQEMLSDADSLAAAYRPARGTGYRQGASRIGTQRRLSLCDAQNGRELTFLSRIAPVGYYFRIKKSARFIFYARFRPSVN